MQPVTSTGGLSAPLFEPHGQQHRITWPLAMPLVVFACFLIGQMLAVVPMVELGLIDRDSFETYPNILYTLGATFSASLCLVLLWVKFFERRSLASIGLSCVPGTPKKLLHGYLTGIGMATFIVGAIYLAGGYRLEQPTLTQAMSLLPVLLLLLTFSVQSFTEEIIFRGYLFSRFTERYGLWTGIAVNAILFTLIHLPGFDFDSRSLLTLVLFAFMTLVFSVYLSLKVIETGSIWFSCAWHAGWNWLFICGFGLPTTGIALDIRPLVLDLGLDSQASTWLTGGIGGPEDSVITSILLTLMCLLGIYRCLNKTRRAAVAGH
ncbi:CPBP family intramembrane glutamic endopeptidase [Shewanella salipaludis]|uniref:CPBP family intramembrane metalloprotease n=1 Tax=Shewanella salipaludis TaxID=2723052 RepID=A0A972FSL3_9GAMM|nr:type II CAAX endopeptidase family protein [Shewanella salipaludis]NMH64961.1 CPBP family intramembrane metalloprotease [Shewanella salipaludis]